MTNHLQPSQHLSPDQLSAFAENVLPEHERIATLTHLTDCADCRQVVFLAQQADPALTAAPVQVETPRRGWFTLPQIFGAATAALACSLILALIVHQRHTETPSTPVATAKVEPPPAIAQPMPTLAPNVAAAPAPAKPAQISAAGTHTSLNPPAAPAPSSAAPQLALPSPRTVGAMGAGMSSGTFTESKQDKTIYGYSALAASTYAALPPKAPAAVAGTVAAPPPPAPAFRMREANSDSAKSKKDVSAAETVTVTGAAPLLDGTAEVTTDTINLNSIQNLPLSGRAAMNQTAARPVQQKPIQLPSKKPAVSVITTAGRTLALDSAGTIFLSTDLGKHWTTVTPQWSGKAVQITYAATPTRLYLQQPAQSQAQTQSNNSINGNVANNGLSQQQAPVPAAGFDLTTASGTVWHSTDGLTWHQR